MTMGVAIWLVVLVLAAVPVKAIHLSCTPTLFSFGTSLSDTGNRHYILPHNTFADNPPYGETYFGHPFNRFSDGRLILDFIASTLGIPFIEPFLTDDVLDYTQGVNFAFSGALALPQGLPYYFDVQVSQFSSFRARALTLSSPSNVPELKDFDQGLYIIFFGRNDLTDSYMVDRMTTTQVLQTVVPKIVRVIVDGIQDLYDNGARNFMVFNVNPQGCQPQYLTLFGGPDVERDTRGCLAEYNRVVEVLNSLLLLAVQNLRVSLTGSTIMFADLYGIAKQAFDNPEKYGFAPDKTLMSCCGKGGKYKYNPIGRCGFRGMVDGEWFDNSVACDNPNEHITWDGVHFTEAFHKYATQLLMAGKFLDPPINLSRECISESKLSTSCSNSG